METPPCTAWTCPSSEEPAPNGTTGARCFAAIATMALDLVGVGGKDDDVGGAGTCHDSPWL